MRRRISLFVLFLLLVFSVSFLYLFQIQSHRKQTINVQIEDKVLLRANLLLKEEEKKRGLGGFKYLPEDQAMLFVFDGTGASNVDPSLAGIWMKNMLFPIDIFWINFDSDKVLRINSIKSRVMPETYPQIFYPNLPSAFVLEAVAGLAEKYNIKIGDIVYLKK